MSNPETWRVVVAAGNTESVAVDKGDRGWWRVNDVPFPAALCVDDAVVDYARGMGWVIAEVRAPGELTRDEAVAAMYAECVTACSNEVRVWFDREMDGGWENDGFRYTDEECEFVGMGARECVSAVRALRPQTPEESPEG